MHLGSPIGRVEPATFSAPIPQGGIDRLAPISVLAGAAAGWMSKPGLRLHRDGTASFPGDPAEAAVRRFVTCRRLRPGDAGVDLPPRCTTRVLELVANSATTVHRSPSTKSSCSVPRAGEVLQFGGRCPTSFTGPSLMG